MKTSRWEKTKFFVSLAVCLVIIICSALWAYALREKDRPASVHSVPQEESPAPLLRPVPGEALRGFSRLCQDETLGCFQAHPAVDLKAARGDPVAAAQAGAVTLAQNDRLWGGVVEITAENGDVCRYAALRWPVAVAPGQQVAAGDVIGAVGEAPCEAALAPHVHFSYTTGAEAVAPRF